MTWAQPRPNTRWRGCSSLTLCARRLHRLDACLRRRNVVVQPDEAHGAARGIVNLVLDGGKVRFSIDTRQADSNGIAISSKLLALAVEVKR